MRYLALGLIKLYRYLISPFIAPACRFTPTCSEYAEEAFARYGFIKGMYLTVCRLFKCHPFHSGGFDPVPDRKN